MRRELLHRQYRNRGPLQNYIGFYSEWKGRFVLVWIMYLIKAAPVFVIPILTAEVINLITNRTLPQEQIFGRLWEILALGFVVIVQNIPTHMLYVRLMSVPCRAVEMSLRSALCTRLQHLSIPYHTQTKIGSLQNKVTRDVESIENMTRMLLDTAPHIICTVVIAVIVTLFKAPIFVLFYLAAVPLAVVLFVAIRKKIRDSNRAFRESIEEMSGRVTEMIRLIPITRAHHVEDVEIDRVNRKLDQIRHTGLQVDLINSIFGSVNWVLLMLFNLCTLIFIAFLYQKGWLNIGVGDIVLLTGYFSSITTMVMQAMNCIPAITKGLESVRSVGEVLECPDIELNENKPQLTEVKGDFVFENVCFSYPGNDKHALENINLHVRAGETIALVGSSGAGKSTMAHLVIGFVRPTSGRLLLDGKDMNTLDLRSYRTFISVVTQETLLFDGTIRENICYGVKPTEFELMDAVRCADLLDFIDSLPDGLDTQVRENGARLSGGQKQRIAIARALLRDPRVLILDEATSALDVESESQIKSALDHLVKGRTTFIVAHRLSTIRDADRIVVMQNGRITEIGNHRELLALDGIYADMNRKFNAAQ
ncbi:ABC transporter ATP-binding protein [uncultured Victivallis sp.]|uniref:ABC transporter ATP-binding protein n=1 Tax=uncultured Victivallis sp. TaxID=354118 RepID=UPI0025F675C8|nr:ABC transporter ATP-binding protein [uncultured Victivallis sp.]